jgi:MscS family membrane protein
MNFLDNNILDNTVRSYLTVLAIITFIILFKRLLSHSMASLLFLLIKKQWKNIEKHQFVSLTIKPLSWVLVVVAVDFAVEKLTFPTVWNIKIHGIALNDIFEKTGNTAIIVVLFYFVISLINFVSLLLEQHSLSNDDKGQGQIVIFFRDLLKVIIAVIGFLFMLRAAFNQDIGTLLTGLSIVGAALALAAKESIENLIASFIIFFDKPFYTGDFLKVNNVSGTVEKIGLRSTRIRTVEKSLVTVPNKQMVDSVVDNLSMKDQLRAEIKISLSDSTPTKKIEMFIADSKDVLTEKKAEIISSDVLFTDVNKDGIMIVIEYYTHAIEISVFNKLKQEINFALLHLLGKHQLQMSTTANNINIVKTNNPAEVKQQSII